MQYTIIAHEERTPQEEKDALSQRAYDCWNASPFHFMKKRKQGGWILLTAFWLS